MTLAITLYLSAKTDLKGLVKTTIASLFTHEIIMEFSVPQPFDGFFRASSRTCLRPPASVAYRNYRCFTAACDDVVKAAETGNVHGVAFFQGRADNSEQLVIGGFGLGQSGKPGLFLQRLHKFCLSHVYSPYSGKISVSEAYTRPYHAGQGAKSKKILASYHALNRMSFL